VKLSVLDLLDLLSVPVAEPLLLIDPSLAGEEPFLGLT
jgi:hypothetical protein